jgi:tetratricopeptide (TPR) repeat protein
LLRFITSGQSFANYEKALESDPKMPSAYYGRGAYRFRKGNLDGAVADYDKAIELMPSYSNAYVSRGAARGLKGDLEGAIEDMKKGATLNPKSISDDSRGKFISPFQGLNQFISENPTNARAYQLRGIFRLLQGKEIEAKQDFHKSLELNPQLKSEIDRIAKKLDR